MVFKYSETIMLRCLPEDKQKLQKTAEWLGVSCQEVLRQGIRLCYNIAEELEREND